VSGSGADRADAFTIPVEVVAADIDAQQHVNNVVYLRWINDVAVAHWFARASPALQARYAWVATRHEIDYRRAAVLGDRLTARTWVGQVDSRRFERLSEIVRDRDGVVCASARTLWCPVDAATGKVVRIAGELRECFPGVGSPLG
jgi:acyl-CoA thioester hydrolase